MKKTLFVIILLSAISCGINDSDPETISAVIYMDSPCNCTYNIFSVIESDDFNKPEINVDFSEFITLYPQYENKIRTDTISVRLESFTSRYNTPRWNLVEILD